jgi:hypothetical protein
MFNSVDCLSMRQNVVKTMVYIHGVTPVVFRDRPWVKPVTVVVVLDGCGVDRCGCGVSTFTHGVTCASP